MADRGLFGAYRVILAPMAGMSDPAFRSLCCKAGADLAFAEMVSAKGLSYQNKKTQHLLDLAPSEKKIGVQLFGHEAHIMAAEATWVEDTLGDALAYLDINMGCPARKIVSKGDGAALMRRPDEAARIVAAVKEAVSCPLTVKFRRGWAYGDECAPTFARTLEAAGADALVVHGRFAQQLYRGEADWGCIARVKEAVHIPVVGNGDVRSGDDALALRDQTGCDAIMIARGALGHPWIFADIQAALAGTPRPKAPSFEERIACARQHAQKLFEYKPESFLRMRKHAMFYVAGMPGAAHARAQLCACATLDDFNTVFDQLSHAIQHDFKKR